MIEIENGRQVFYCPFFDCGKQEDREGFTDERYLRKHLRLVHFYEEENPVLSVKSDSRLLGKLSFTAKIQDTFYKTQLEQSKQIQLSLKRGSFHT